MLWIAFIFLYLWDTTQQIWYWYLNWSGCELLSFFCIFGIQHNPSPNPKYETPVVNCFHFSVSLGYNTTGLSFFSVYYWLWIAFIFLYLWDTTQLLDSKGVSDARCELLSFFCIFGIQHNYNHFVNGVEYVVNCFHFSVSLGYNTTKVIDKRLLCSLWIAFIFLYLWDTTQRFIFSRLTLNCCELLSFFCIFGIQHNSS